MIQIIQFFSPYIIHILLDNNPYPSGTKKFTVAPAWNTEFGTFSATTGALGGAPTRPKPATKFTITMVITTTVTSGTVITTYTSTCSAAITLTVYDKPAVDCVMSAWTAWSTCSATCAGGIQTQSRYVVTQGANGGLACPTLLTQQQTCNTFPCPINCVVDAWSLWSDCTLTCGGGVQSSTRKIITAAAYGGVPCPSLTQQQACNVQLCPIDCKISKWSEWSACSTSCGEGTQTQTRYVDVKAANGGLPCLKILTNTQTCNLGLCPTDATVPVHFTVPSVPTGETFVVSEPTTVPSDTSPAAEQNLILTSSAPTSESSFIKFSSFSSSVVRDADEVAVNQGIYTATIADEISLYTSVGTITSSKAPGAATFPLTYNWKWIHASSSSLSANQAVIKITAYASNNKFASSIFVVYEPLTISSNTDVTINLALSVRNLQSIDVSFKENIKNRILSTLGVSENGNNVVNFDQRRSLRSLFSPLPPTNEHFLKVQVQVNQISSYNADVLSLYVESLISNGQLVESLARNGGIFYIHIYIYI